MTDVIKFSKKAFTWSVVFMTIVWSMGIAALVPATAQAAECPELDPGTDFKVRGGSAVYFLDSNLEKRAYQHEKHFRMWHRGEGNAVFAGVVTIDPACADNYDLPGELPIWVGPFPGSLVTNVETSKVYVVADGNKIYPIPSEAVAKGFWGSNVFSRVMDILPTYWVNFSVQAEAFSGDAPVEGSLVRYNSNLYVMQGGSLHKVEGEMPAGAVKQALDATAAQWTAWAGVMSEATVTAASLTENPGRTTGGSGDSDVPAADAKVKVSLSASTPAGGTVPINVDNVEFTKVVLENTGSDAAKVTSVRIGRSGLGAVANFTSVTLYDGATKLGTSRTSWVENKYMNYNIPGGLVIPAGSSKVLTIKARIGTAGTYNALGVDALTLSAGTVSGLPVYGNEKLGVNVTVGGVTVTGRGTTTQTKKIGTTDVTLAEFRLAMGSTEDAELKSITLENKGTAGNDDVANLFLYKGATKLAGPAQIASNDQVVFVLDEALLMEKSKNYDLKVVGDLVDGDTKTVEFVLDATTDLTAVGKIYNTNLSVTATDFDAAADASTTATTIDGAELNISFTSVAQDTADDRDDLEFGRLTLGAGSSDVEITSLILTMDEGDGDADATNNKDVDEVELVDTLDGTAYSGTMTDGGDGDADNETWTFDDTIYLTSGQPRSFIIRGDLPTGIGANDTYRVIMTVNTTNVVAETKPGNDTIDNFSIGSITGKFVTVKAPELIVRSTNMVAGNAVLNQTGVVIYKGSLEASVASNVTVENIGFEGGNTAAGNVAEVVNNFDEDNWSSVEFYTKDKGSDTWVLRQTLTSSDLGDGVFAFDSLDFVVKAGSANRMDFEVRGTLKGTFTANTTVHLQLDDITARDSDGDSVTAETAGGTLLAENAEIEIVRTVTLQSSGILYLSMRNADAGFNKDRIMLAGDGMWVGKLRVRADYEDIKLRDLKLTNASADDEDNVESVCLYKASVVSNDNLVACTTLDDNDVAFFNDIDVTVTQGTHDWYIYVKSRPMGEGVDETSDSHDVISFSITSTSDDVVATGEADLAFGDNNGTAAAGEIVFDLDLDGTFDEAADITTASTKSFEIAGSKITDVELVSSFGGEVVDTVINGTGTYTLAILKVITAAHSNADASGDALKLAIENVVFDVEKHNTTTISAATIERINGSSSSYALVDNAVDAVGETTGDWTLANVDTALGADANVDAGETAYFVVKATIGSLDATTGVADHIRVSLDNLNSGTNNIDWRDGYNATDFDYLRIDKSSITGTKVAESL